MGINRESDVAANLQIGPTTLGMVRLYIETDAIELPLDFEPEEAEEIAEELRAAAGEGARDRRQPRRQAALSRQLRGTRPGSGSATWPSRPAAVRAKRWIRRGGGRRAAAPASGQRWISASQASARIRPASGGSRSIGKSASTAQKKRSHQPR